ncbi:MAG: DciA family protein [Sedimentisphaerales bacterium]
MNTEVLLNKANRAVKFRRKPVRSSSPPRLAVIGEAGNINGPPVGEVSPLADELALFLKKVARPAVRNVSIPDAFEQIAGEYLAQNCRIESITAGILKVKTKPGPFMFELQTKAGQIVEQLKRQCPSANIRQIRLICSE